MRILSEERGWSENGHFHRRTDPREILHTRRGRLPASKSAIHTLLAALGRGGGVVEVPHP